LAVNFPEKYQKTGKDASWCDAQFTGHSPIGFQAMLAHSRQPPRPLQAMPPPLWDGSGSSLSRLVLDQLSIAIALLDVEGRVLFCNACTDRLAGNQTAIKIRSGRQVSFSDAQAERTFQSTLCRFANCDLFEEESSVLIVANGVRDGEQPLIGAFRLLSDHPRTILMTLAHGRGSASEASLQCLMQAFNLTPAERRLAHYLASGGRLTDAAKSFGLSRHTVRNQLRSIFEKVGVQRQADLTRLMLAGSVYSGMA
jgi:DNA-binding CsgD family transcriptional regulator